MLRLVQLPRYCCLKLCYYSNRPQTHSTCKSICNLNSISFLISLLSKSSNLVLKGVVVFEFQMTFENSHHRMLQASQHMCSTDVGVPPSCKSIARAHAFGRFNLFCPRPAGAIRPCTPTFCYCKDRHPCGLISVDCAAHGVICVFPAWRFSMRTISLIAHSQIVIHVPNPASLFSRT